MQSLLRHFQRRPKTTLSLIGSTTAAIAILSTSPFSSISPPRLKHQSSSAMTSKFPESSNPTPSRPLPTKEWPARKYTTRHTAFPYTAKDLTPMDTSPDAEFYSSPRFITHIDDHAISVLRDYYGSVLPHAGTNQSSNSASFSPSTASEALPANRGPNILDLCSSWISHYPPSLEAASAAGTVAIAGIGMNNAELAANPLFRRPGADKKSATSRYLVRDLNANPSVPPFHAIAQDADAQPQSKEAEASIDATTLTVSIDYLTTPVTLLASLLERTRPGGTLHVAVSNRCFPTKAVRRWLGMSEEQRLEMVAEMLVWSGWSEVEILCLSDGNVPENEGAGDEGGSSGVLQKFLQGMGMGGGARVDPLWIVRGRKG